MIQILKTDSNSNTSSAKKSLDKLEHIEKRNKKKLFTVQFFISILAFFVFISFFVYYKFTLNKKESLSNILLNNYNISRLYSNYTSADNNYINSSNLIIGIIEIPNIKIYYPIFSQLDDELLKIAPCKFYGKMPNTISNLCIAGHNYNNEKFFSNINKLKFNDEIIIYNQKGEKYSYFVFENYEVRDTDLSPIYLKSTNAYELTLVSCNNSNGNRIIIKAKTKNL